MTRALALLVLLVPSQAFAQTYPKAAKADAAVNVKRVATPRIDDYFAEPTQSLDLLRSTLEIKTTWHPVGW